MHVYEVRPRKDNRGVDLISAVLPFGRRAECIRFRDQKITAPHTDDVKGGCSPQNTIVLNQGPADWQSGNTSDLCIGKSLMLPSRPM